MNYENENWILTDKCLEDGISYAIYLGDSGSGLLRIFDTAISAELVKITYNTHAMAKAEYCVGLQLYNN